MSKKTRYRSLKSVDLTEDQRLVLRKLAERARPVSVGERVEDWKKMIASPEESEPTEG